ARGFVDERRDLVRGPSHVRDAEADQRALPHGQRLASLERRAHVAPSLVDERARGAVRTFGRGVALEEALARALRAGTAAARADVRRELVEEAPADAARPTRVAHRGEADDAER